MAFNGSGTFNRLFNWATDKGNSVPVTASRMDSEMDGIATGLTTAICKDGQTVTTARIPFVLGTSAMQGTVGGVSYSFSNDVDTGLYSPATDQVALATGGVQVLAGTSATITIPVTLAVTGTSAFTGNATFAGTFTASATASAGYFSGLGAMPVGSIIDYAGSSAPSGWLLCFGQSLLRASFPALFTAIGTTHGAADGTHFSLPDCRGRMTAGKDDMGGSTASRITVAGGNFNGTTLGTAGGAQNHTLTIPELPVVTPAGIVVLDDGGQAVIASGGGLNGFASGSRGTANISGSTFVGAPFGSGNSHPIMPPAIILNKIIFAGV